MDDIKWDKKLEDTLGSNMAGPAKEFIFLGLNLALALIAAILPMSLGLVKSQKNLLDEYS
jgi:hypothetical protein